MSKLEIQESLLGFISRNFMVDKDIIALDKSLVDTGIIDSMGLIEIATFMEHQFGFKVQEEQMNRENFGSVLQMVDFIQKQTQN
jgi:acyl carrier protein